MISIYCLVRLGTAVRLLVAAAVRVVGRDSMQAVGDVCDTPLLAFNQGLLARL